MGYKLTILFSLLATLNLCLALQLPTSRILSTNYVTKSGTVALNKDSNGFYVNVDFSYNINDASDSEGYDPSLARVSLALYTSQTVLTYSCLGFYSYYCQSYECTQYSTSSTPVFPDFEVSTGYLASTQVYLDYYNWNLQNYATIATSCFSQADSSYGSQRYGVLGLGINASQAGQNFDEYSPTFFVYVAQDGFSGTLQFGTDCDTVTSKPNAGTLSTTSEWQISNESVVTVQGYYIGTSQNAIFDLNANGIGLPVDVFEQLIQYLDQNSGLGCNTGLSMPNCTYNGQISDLPTITITMQGVGIDLPPSLYAINNPYEATTGEQVTLKFRALDPSYTGQNYVTSQYTSYIIFDQTFLSYYYAQFAYNNGAPTVTLYNANSSKAIWPYIAGGVAGIVIIIIVIVCCIKRRKNRKRLAQARGNSSNINGASQAEEVPLAQGHINIPSAVVNYPTYNYQYPPQFPSEENRPYNFNNNLNNNGEQGMNNFAAPVQTEQVTSGGEGYVPPVPQIEGGAQAGNQQAGYGNDYLQARQAYIRGGM